MHETTAMGLGHAVALLAAMAVAATLFRRLGLGAVLGYLAAGVLIGPSVLGVVRDPQAVLHVAEFGVVMFLFIIGLEMRPARLWNLRREIFGTGAVQVGLCALLLTGVAMAAGLVWYAALIAGFGFALSSTAIVMQLLEERGENADPAGQRVVSVLLFEDLAIVPLLALVAVLAGTYGSAVATGHPVWMTVALAVGAVAVVIVAGRWVVNPFFRLLARYGGREIMTMGALFVVLGAAYAMSLGGLSMAMGAFLAGVLLSESTFRHQLEADVEPFRGLLLGLFFLSVGMSLDLGVVFADWPLVLGGLAAFMGTKFDPRTASILSAVVILSMAVTPLRVLIADRLRPRERVSTDGVDHAENLRERVLIIGFGRFAQVVSQPLLARDVDVSIIEVDVEMIRAAGNFGFKVFYGDGARLDVLRTSGAGEAETILVCVDRPEVADRIVELVKAEFPLTKLFVRAFDRGHSLRLIEAKVDYHIRETFESALTFGEQVLIDLGFSDEEVRETIEDVRRRDQERLALQVSGGLTAGRALMRGNMPTPQPAPYVTPRREGRLLNDTPAATTEESGPS